MPWLDWVTAAVRFVGPIVIVAIIVIVTVIVRVAVGGPHSLREAAAERRRMPSMIEPHRPGCVCMWPSPPSPPRRGPGPPPSCVHLRSVGPPAGGTG